MNDEISKNEFEGDVAEPKPENISSQSPERTDANTVNEVFDSTALPDETQPPLTAEEFADADEVKNDNSVSEQSYQEEYRQPNFNPNPAFVTPNMPPKIELHPYEVKEKTAAPKEFKLFALILSFLIVISGCLVGGYFLGKQNVTASATPNVNLTKKPSSNALSAAEVYGKVDKSIVGIVIYNEEGIAANATGVIYSADGYIVTNDHIYASVPSAKFKIYTSDGKQYDAKYVAGDTRSDLAVLKMDATGFTPAVFGNSTELAVGEDVVAIGRPSGATEKSSISEGIVSALDIRVSVSSSYSTKFIQTDSAINPGSSGGALSNMFGQVIGITSSKLVGDEYDGVGYAIPTVQMKPIIESLIKNKYVDNRARLGITYREVDSVTAGLKNISQGLYIVSIDKTSDLYGRSVEENDIITQVNGRQITNSTVILDAIESAKPNDTISLTIKTAKKGDITISVKLLADKGSSSYSSQKPVGNGNNSNTSSQDYNSSQFTFPNGE